MPRCAVSDRISIEQSVLQLFGWMIGGVGLLLGSFAYHDDLNWNNIVRGNTDLKLGLDSTSLKLKLNLTLEQQTVLMRETKLEIGCLVVLSLFLITTIGVYTYAWINDSNIKPNRVSNVVTIFHGLGSIVLACLSISMLNGIIAISGHDKAICLGRYNNELLLEKMANKMLLQFFHDTSCVCAHIKTFAVLDSVGYNLVSLKNLGICQNSLCKQITGICLFFYTMIAIALACTQMKDLISMKSGPVSRPSNGRVSSFKRFGNRSGGINTSNKPKPGYCTCTSTSSTKTTSIMKMDPQFGENNNNNNNMDLKHQEISRSIYFTTEDEYEAMDKSLCARYSSHSMKYAPGHKVGMGHVSGRQGWGARHT